MNEEHTFQEGYAAFSDGKSMLHDNPYAKGSESHEAWACGFGAAWAEEINSFGENDSFPTC